MSLHALWTTCTRLLGQLWRRHQSLMHTSRLYAAVVTLAAAAVAGRFTLADLRRQFADLSSYRAAGDSVDVIDEDDV